MKPLLGKWNYQSFTSFRADVDRSQQPPVVKVPAQLAATWTPPSVMEFSTDGCGKITGSASLGPIQFKISGSTIPPNDADPKGIELIISVDALFAKAVTGIAQDAVYKLQGAFLKDSDHIVGTVLSVSNDLGFQSDGTSGPFVLYPAATTR